MSGDGVAIIFSAQLASALRAYQGSGLEHRPALASGEYRLGGRHGSPTRQHLNGNAGREDGDKADLGEQNPLCED